MKLSRNSVIFATVLCPICFISILLSLTGTIVSAHNGFAVDNKGLLYVGKDSRMDVYNNGQYVDTIYKESKGYRFTIQDELLYIAINGRVEVRDLSGNLIETLDDSIWPTEQYKLDKQKKEFITDNIRYVATNKFGFYMITKYSNGGIPEIVYHIPVVDYILNCLIVFTFISLFLIFVTSNAKRSFTENEKRK